MIILIHDAHRVKTFLELFAVCSKTNHGENYSIVRADTKDLGITPRVYGVATGRAGVAGNDSKVTAADAKN